MSARSNYLREVKQKREEGYYDIVYLDETWINAHHRNNKNGSQLMGQKKKNGMYPQIKVRG